MQRSIVELQRHRRQGPETAESTEHYSGAVNVTLRSWMVFLQEKLHGHFPSPNSTPSCHTRGKNKWNFSVYCKKTDSDKDLCKTSLYRSFFVSLSPMVWLNHFFWKSAPFACPAIARRAAAEG